MTVCWDALDEGASEVRARPESTTLADAWADFLFMPAQFVFGQPRANAKADEEEKTMPKTEREEDHDEALLALFNRFVEATEKNAAMTDRLTIAIEKLSPHLMMLHPIAQRQALALEAMASAQIVVAPVGETFAGERL
jgi:Lon protease-like protein